MVLEDSKGRRVVAPRCTGCDQAQAAEKAAQLRATQRQAQAKEAEERRQQAGAWLQQAGVDVAALAGASFATYDPAHNPEALGAMRTIADGYKAGASRNVYLWSELAAPGVGKSHLLVAAARQLLLTGHVAPSGLRYVRETRMVLTLRGLVNGGRPEQYLDRLIAADLLLIDDLGKAKLDSAWLQELIYELFAAREGRPTWATSNFSLEWLRERWAWYSPLASRLAGGGLVLEMGGPDMRMQHPHNRGG